MKKICSKCKVEKDVSEFSPTPKGIYGVHSQCKQCKREYAANRWKNDPEYRKRKSEYDKSDHRMEYSREYMRKKREDKEFREKSKAYMKEYHVRVDSTSKARERRKDPKVREEEIKKALRI